MHVDILYEDNHMLAVNKPPGAPVQMDASEDPCLIDAVKYDLIHRHNKPGNAYAVPVHRLDRPSSGVLLFAKTSKATSRLMTSFAGRKVRKIYWVIVEGIPQTKKGRLTGWLLKNKATNRSELVPGDTPGAKNAALSYEVTAASKDRALLRIELETGRGHQIRVQLADIGHPVAGDLRYGHRQGFGSMIALHAGRLEVPHPTRDETIVIIAPPPARWRELFGDALVDAIGNTPEDVPEDAPDPSESRP
ncbi:RluA family pseudouridine synthase [bacterium]|nr:RluA family pseudouridine synthase [bacterium]MCB9476559.1 RluA family pseudouridine synthase [Deltaproteobacteria bacterium]